MVLEERFDEVLEVLRNGGSEDCQDSYASAFLLYLISFCFRLRFMTHDIFVSLHTGIFLLCLVEPSVVRWHIGKLFYLFIHRLPALVLPDVRSSQPSVENIDR
jgi:hypothetical protein